MKKVLILVITLISFSTINAQSKIIKANPLGLAVGVANVGFEFAIGEFNSLTVMGNRYKISDVTGVGVGLEYRWYFGNENLNDWHAGPNLGIFSLEDNKNTKAGVLNFGGEVGHQWIFNNNLVVDLFGGLSYITGGSNLSGFNATTISLGVSLGYAW